ncbi:hypothetical protein [Longimicrobium terrae]|uniref:Uncharacterized protein n=1 Tax=Longimicrobium terrae TaxID=1639882 RepID=A0A841H1R9_9BACT|nr:hypothetical protein [Longimicrobium terrae]MBB4637521.1 hypothetical protein [Longimicrobium terrae]MBB6071918.1 hypothetical protein [Longimicrobium terrae]NNC30465.1 hypothetical protein [Longimicrobium terrae]
MDPGLRILLHTRSEVETFPVPQPHPLKRPYVESVALAGFMDPASAAASIPWLGALSPEALGEFQARFGAGARLGPADHAGKPSFHAVRGPAALKVLADARSLIQPSDAWNLAGFEWIAIEKLIAGRLFSDPVPIAELLPAAQDEGSIARFCIYGYGSQMLLEAVPGGPGLQSALPFLLDAAGPLQVNGDIVGVPFRVIPLPTPVRVLVADDRAVALDGIGKLIALLRLGVKRALCVVHYGYSPSMMDVWPQLPQDLLAADRPPLIADFLDPAVAVSVPTRPRSTTAVLTAQMVQLG